jgi:long-chain fatty acid transport protein
MKRFGRILLLSSSLALWAATTHASGFFISQIGGPDASPTDPDPSAIFWNPAALGGVSGLEVQAELISILRFARYDREVGYQWNVQDQSWNTVTGTARSASLFNYIPLPFFGVALQLSDRFVLGLGVYSPFGASSSWEEADGPQAYHSISGSNTSTFFSTSLSFSILSWLHAGLTLSYVHSVVSSERLADFSDIIGGLPEDPSLLATMQMEGFAGGSFSAEVGLFFDFERLKVGVSYQPPIAVKNEGRIVLTPLGQKLKDVIGDHPAEADGEMSYTLPDNLKASVDYYLRSDLRLRLYLEWVNWSRFDAITIDVQRRTISLLPETLVDRHAFHDAFGGTLQLKYWLWPRLAVFGGIGFDTNAIPDETLSAVFIDSDKIAAHLGVDLMLWGGLRAKVGLKYVHFFENTVESSGRVPVADGTYGSEFVMIDLNLSYLRPRKEKEVRR